MVKSLREAVNSGAVEGDFTRVQDTAKARRKPVNMLFKGNPLELAADPMVDERGVGGEPQKIL